MKALTLTQPWALLVVSGLKVFETRGWRTSYTGSLAIHAAKGWTADDRDFLSDLIREGVLPQMDTRTIPLGAVVGEATLIRCQSAGRDLETYLRSKGERGLQELSFGDFSEGRFAWRLVNPVAYPEPIPAKGALGLWEWTKPS